MCPVPYRRAPHRKADQVDWLRLQIALTVLLELLDGAEAQRVRDLFEQAHQYPWTSCGPALGFNAVSSTEGVRAEVEFLLEDVLSAHSVGSDLIPVSESCIAWRRHREVPDRTSEEWCEQCAAVHQLAGRYSGDLESELPLPVLVQHRQKRRGGTVTNS